MDFRSLYQMGESDEQRLWARAWDEAVAAWLSAKSEATRRAYAAAYADWTEFLGGYGMAFAWLATPEQAAAWLDCLLTERGRSASTVRARASAVSALYAHVGALGLFVDGRGRPRRNPFGEVERPRGRRAGRAIPSTAMQGILARLGRRRDAAARRDRALLLVLWQSGWPVGRVLAMRRAEVSGLSPPLRQAVDAYLAGRCDEGPEAFVWRPLRTAGVSNLGVSTLAADRHITPSSAREMVRRHLRWWFAQTGEPEQAEWYSLVSFRKSQSKQE